MNIQDAIDMSIIEDRTVEIEYTDGVLEDLSARCEDYMHEYQHDPLYWGTDDNGSQWQIRVTDAPEPALD